MSQPAKYHSDIIINGGGMVGLLLANALARQGLTIAIVETNPKTPTWNNQQFDQRVSAITRASQQIFTTLDIWQDIVAMRASPFREMHVWDSTGDGVIHFDSADIGESCLGHIIENSAIQTALYQHLKELEHVRWYRPAVPKQLTINEQSALLILDDNTQLEACIVIGADGGRSWTRDQANITVKSNNYNQTAVVATVKTQHYHKDTAWQRFLPTGPLAFLPLTEGYSSIVWSTTPEHAETLLTMTDDDFKQSLAEGFDNKLGDIVETSARAKFPLQSQHANQYVKHRLALIGDAAHTIHPLAGQGVNLGFADAATLAEVIVNTNNAKKDIGSYHLLRRYERWRKGDNLAMLSAMTGFKSLFGANNVLVKSLRNTGLNLTNNFGPVKNMIIRHAMGLEGDLPKLARCEQL